MSYIIRGILDRRLPWSLVLLGVMISVTLELCGVSSLAFAVGVYLPLSASAPIFLGGAIRWIVDRQRRRDPQQARLTELEFAAESDKSPGVLLASGYIAGGAIAGIVIAFMGGLLVQTTTLIQKWSTNHNPFYSQADWNAGRANLLSLVPFALLIALLYLVGRERLLAATRRVSTPAPPTSRLQ
jgi:hypothetical protein